MEEYAIIHLKCGQPATLQFYEEDNWIWDGVNETCEPVNRLIITCKTCDTTSEIEPKRE